MKSKYPRRYYFDLMKRRFRRKVRGYLPDWMMSFITLKRENPNQSAAFDLLLDREVNPWTSPNIWQEIINNYSNLELY